MEFSSNEIAVSCVQFRKAQASIDSTLAGISMLVRAVPEKVPPVLELLPELPAISLSLEPFSNITRFNYGMPRLQ